MVACAFPMAKTSGTLPPRIDEIRLENLGEGYLGDLSARAGIEGLRFADLDLSGMDLAAASFSECVLDTVSAHEASFKSATFTEVAITRLDAPVFIAGRARFRDVTIASSRVGSADLFDSALNSVRITGSKLGFVNLRGAQLQDVLFEGCSIDELDLGSATLNRVSFIDTTITSLRMAGARLANVDLRGAQFSTIDGFESLSGATLDAYQVSSLATAFAAHLGIVIED